MLSEKMTAALNEQVNREMYSAYLYMAMSSYSNSIGLKGFANWFMVQYHEEMFHAMKLYEYIHSQSGAVALKAIDEPPAAFEGPLDMMTKTLAHEQMVTRSINDLMDIAISEKDHATRIFLQWYVTEQVEEEENDNDIIDQLKLIKDNPQGLMMLDRELAQRAATVPLDFSKVLKRPFSSLMALTQTLGTLSSFRYMVVMALVEMESPTLTSTWVISEKPICSRTCFWDESAS
jgi:ferritin